MPRVKSNLGQGNVFRLALPRPPNDQGKYSSNKTRFVSLQGFMGGAEIEEEQPQPLRMPHDDNENLEAKFNSGVNRTDMPKMWGHPDVIRKLGNREMRLSNELRAWRRVGGEPLYRKVR